MQQAIENGIVLNFINVIIIRLKVLCFWSDPGLSCGKLVQIYIAWLFGPKFGCYLINNPTKSGIL